MKKKEKSGLISRVLYAGCPASLPSLCAMRRRLASSGLPAVSPRFRGAGWAIHRCSALLTMRFAMPRPLPGARWALTPPFHPYRRRLAATEGGIFSVALSVRLRPWRRGVAGKASRPSFPVRRRPGRYPASRPHEPGLSSTAAFRRSRGSAARS